MSILKKNTVSIAVSRKNRIKDNAGGYTEMYTPIAGSPFTGRIIRAGGGSFLARKPTLIEGRPGDVMVDAIVLVFPLGTDIRAEDRCTIGTVDYDVKGVRTYSRSVQVNVEAII